MLYILFWEDRCRATISLPVDTCRCGADRCTVMCIYFCRRSLLKHADDRCYVTRQPLCLRKEETMQLNAKGAGRIGHGRCNQRFECAKRYTSWADLFALCCAVCVLAMSRCDRQYGCNSRGGTGHEKGRERTITRRKQKYKHTRLKKCQAIAAYYRDNKSSSDYSSTAVHLVNAQQHSVLLNNQKHCNQHNYAVGLPTHAVVCTFTICFFGVGP